jgi:hypothetical protein
MVDRRSHLYVSDMVIIIRQGPLFLKKSSKAAIRVAVSSWRSICWPESLKESKKKTHFHAKFIANVEGI